MGWAKFDDLYDDSRKVKRAWKRHGRAVGLHAMAITYCARHELDGAVDFEWIEEKLPEKRERDKCVNALLEVGLFEPLDDAHFLVHDYLDYNPSRAELVERRRKDSERKSRGGRHGNPNGFRTDSTRTDDGFQAASGSPGPARPGPLPPKPPKGDRGRDRDAFESSMREWTAEHFPDAQPSHVAALGAWLRGRNVEPTPENMRAYAAEFPQWSPGIIEVAA